jgi:uncharacterized protein YjgD (DUF1641 family)
MAQPISLEAPPRDRRQELLARLDQVQPDRAEAILETLDLLQLLHDRGVLELLRGAVSAGGKLTEHAAAAADSQPAVTALRNLIIMSKMLASIEPKMMQHIATAVDETIGSQRSPQAQDPPRLFTIFGRFKHHYLRRTLDLASTFIAALGRQLSSPPG